MQSETEKKINQTAFENLTRQKNDLAERVIRLEDVNAVLRSENERLNNYVIGGYNEMLGEAAKRLEEAEEALELIAKKNFIGNSVLTAAEMHNRAREYFEKYGEEK